MSVTKPKVKTKKKKTDQAAKPWVTYTIAPYKLATKDGKIHLAYHTDNFRKLTEEEI